METFFDKIISYIITVPDYLLYLFLFLSAVLENLAPPIPGDTITALGAFLVGTGRLNFWLVYGSTTLGSLAGFMILVQLGRILGRVFFMEKNYRFFSAQAIVDAEQWYQKYGYGVVLLNRFMPGVRSVISLVTGISHLSMPRVTVLAGTSAAVWNLAWISAGYFLGDNWETVEQKAALIMRNYNIAAGLIILLVSGYLVFRYWQKRKNS